MFKKSVKRSIAVLLTLVLLLTSLPLTAFAETTSASTETEDEYIYYSDLFYGYSYYLANAPYLKDHYDYTQMILDKVYNDYMDSPNFAWTNIKNSLAMATNLKEWAKMITDAFGLTSFTYEKALDAANVDIATQLTGGSEIAKAYGTELKWVKKINDILKVYDTFDKNYDISVMTETEVFTAMFATIGDSGVLASINKTTLTTLQEDILPHISTITSRLSKGADILTAAKTIATGIMMEDFRMELIDEILSSTSSGTMLYDGMYRLKNQLRNGFVSYFLDQYLTDKVLNEIADKVVKKITGTVLGDQAGTYALIGAITKVASWIVFDCIFDVPDIDDLTKQMVLSEYAVNLHTLLKNKVAVFNTQFETEDIYDLEALATAYSAATNAALEASDKLKLSTNADILQTITDMYSGVVFYNEWVESAKSYVKSTSVENRIITNFGTWTLNEDTTLYSASDTMEDKHLYVPYMGLNADLNKPFNSKYYDLDVAENQHIKINGDLKVECSGSTFIIGEGSTLEIQNNFSFECPSFSGSSGTGADFINYGILNILGNAIISGGYSYFFGGSQSARTSNYGKFCVSGNMTLNVLAGEFKNEGEIDCGGLLTLQGMGILNNNNLIKTNDFYLSDSVDMPYSDFCFNMDKTDAALIISGDFKNDYGNSSFNGGWGLSQFSGKRWCNIVSGIVVFDGNQQQEVGGLSAANIRVTNPCGIKYVSNNYLYGKYELNGYPLDTNGFRTYIFDGFINDSSNYGELWLSGSISIETELNANLYGSGNVSLSANVNGDISLSGGELLIQENSLVNIAGNLSVSTGNLTVLENSIVSVYGDVVLKGLTSSYGYSIVTPTKYRLKNNGQLNVLGNILYEGFFTAVENNGTIYVEDDFFTFRVKMDKSSAKVIVGGDYYCGNGYDYSSHNIENINSGEVIFNGAKQQNIRGLIAPVVILNNNTLDGIIFTTPIKPSVLFDHRGNNFTLYNSGTGSTFVDYDGDGMKDNVDPEPTVGNPCALYFESEDTEKGAVSLSKVETIGGTKITVTATPTFKYDFSKWVTSSGTTVSTSAECTIVATGDETYTAVFTKRQQPITTQAEGGTINVVSKAEIESEVKVTVTENDGYVYTEGSLAYNGIPVENGSFIMPDEAVTLTAEFVRNENYFALNEALTTAKSYTYQSYSKESFANLTSVISTAEVALVNDITAEEREKQIAWLQAAIDGLEEKFISSVTLKTTPTLYINVPDMINNVSVLVTYDNGTTITVTGADCTIEGYDASVLGEQSITITYGEVTGTASVTVQKRILDECTVSEIVDQIYDGVKEEYTTAPVVSYNRTDETLIENTDYKIEYSNNTAVGEATITITGIGNYAGSISLPFNIYCEHNYECIGQVDATCTQTGYQTEKCTICGKTNAYENIATEGLPESEHNYANRCDVSYYYTDDGASSLVLVFSSSTLTESTHDKIYIYDETDTLLGTYSGSSLAGKSITVSGDTVRIRLTTDSSVVKYGFSLDSITSYFDYLLLPTIEHNYGDWSTVTVATPVATGVKHKLCTECGDEVTEEIPVVESLVFKGASLTLHHNLAINYKVDKALFDTVGYTNPYVVFEVGGKTTTVKAYAVEGERYVFRFRNIAPNQMNDTIYATLYATYNGVEYASETREYSVAEYCYSTLSKYSADDYAELRTLLVDLLHYGAQSQLYTKYNVENLVNANLTEAQLAWGTAEDPTLTNSLNTAYETVENPLITWKGASLNLNDSVSMRFKFIAEDIEGLSLKITGETDEWNITANNFVLEDGVYSVRFSGLNAGQMSEKVYLTMYKDGVAVSNTVCYSIESYAYSKQDSTIDHLSDLVKAMMKYGNSAHSYVN